MVRKASRLLGGVFLVAVLGPLAGCQYDHLKQENISLWSQNTELQEELARNRLALDAYESQTHQLLAERESAQRPVSLLTNVAAANTGFTDIKGVEAIQTRERVTVRVPGDVLFSPGKATLRKSALSTLSQIAQVIKNEYPTNMVLINGFTDSDPIKKSKWSDNLELSLQRAAAVHRYLQKQGANPSHLQAVGQGQWHPRNSKAKSRRVEIVVKLD